MDGEMTDEMWYALQSIVTKPCRTAGWLPRANGDLRALRLLVRGLVTHYRTDDLHAILPRSHSG
jgi:hypothetical protein